MIALVDLIAGTRGTAVGNPDVVEFTEFAYDSRMIEPGQLFVALVTDTGDGHAYIEQAIRAGATGVLCQRLPAALQDGICYVQVDDSQQALTDYSRYILAARRIQVIAISGSLGKTSTKEAISGVLAQRFTLFKSYGNYNGRLGLSIALGKLEEGQRLAVLELAADSMNEIRDLAAITRPHIGVVTCVSSSHLQIFGSLERIAQEKGMLVKALPAEGAAILNGDDERVRAMAARTKAQVVFYGLGSINDLVGSDISITPQGTGMIVKYQGQKQRLFIPFLGAQHASTMLAAAAVGMFYHLTWDEITAGLAQLTPLPGRTRLLPGYNGSQILDDSYNANPASTLAALETSAALPAARRWFVMGDMAQLGEQAPAAHRAVGRTAGHLVDFIVTKGDNSRLAGEEAARNGLDPKAVFSTFTNQDAIRMLQSHLLPGDLVLVKGSADARLEFITRELLADPSQAAAVLPRQNTGWQAIRSRRPDRPTWVEINLDAVAHNVHRLGEIVGPGVQIMAVLKADGYGHGAVKVARTALNNGASWLGVACLGEAITLREAGISAPILVLGYTPAWQARDAVLWEITITVFSLDVAQALGRAAANLDRPAACHIKVDTGMGRLGLLPEDVLPFTRALTGISPLKVDGLFTHMSSADEPDPSYTLQQLAAFDGVIQQLTASGLLPPHVHAANSAGLLRFPRSHYNLVRPGISLYGLNPSADTLCPTDFQAALSWKSQIAQVKELPVGSPISYGRTFVTKRPSRLAVIPVGYADGFRRAPRNWGYVLVRGQRAPIVGVVCMDQTIIDVTEIALAAAGDEVVLIGSQGNETLSVDQVARQLGTINYEIVSEILARVPRFS